MRAMEPTVEGFVERDGVKVAYEVYGDGEPTVLLEMSDGTKPALFRCGDGYVYLVMPLAG